jgi:hypothetical protein
VKKLCILVCMTIAGAVGWWLGSRVGIMTAFALSTVGSIAGIYLGWRINRHYLG